MSHLREHQPQTWAGPIVLGFIEFLIFIALGRMLRADRVWTMTEKVLDKWDGRLGRG